MTGLKNALAKNPSPYFGVYLLEISDTNINFKKIKGIKTVEGDADQIVVEGDTSID